MSFNNIEDRCVKFLFHYFLISDPKTIQVPGMPRPLMPGGLPPNMGGMGVQRMPVPMGARPPLNQPLHAMESMRPGIPVNDQHVQHEGMSPKKKKGQTGEKKRKKVCNYNVCKIALTGAYQCLSLYFLGSHVLICMLTASSRCQLSIRRITSSWSDLPDRHQRTS